MAEFCYGTKGIIEFFDVLFGQFTTKKAVSAKFNFYSGIKRQFAAIERQIQQELENGAQSKIKNGFVNSGQGTAFKNPLL